MIHCKAKFFGAIFLSLALSSCSDDDQELAPLMVDFSVSQAELAKGGAVQFTAAISGTVENYFWEFEGGSPGTSTAESPTVTYVEEGTFNVLLRVSNSSVEAVELKEDFITVQKVPLKADFSADKTRVKMGDSVAFTSAIEGEPGAIAWTFEGGSPATSTDRDPTVVYESPGTYGVTLTISDNTDLVEEVKEGYITVDPLDCSLVKVTFGQDFFITIAYNDDRTVKEINNDDLKTITVYENSELVKTIEYNQFGNYRGESRYEYHPGGALAKLTVLAGTDPAMALVLGTYTFTYDANGHLREMEVVEDDGNVTYTRTYETDSAGNITKEFFDAGEVTYVYDKAINPLALSPAFLGNIIAPYFPARWLSKAQVVEFKDGAENPAFALEANASGYTTKLSLVGDTSQEVYEYDCN